MTDELCAREGCGAPKAWHDRNSTVDELATWPDDAKRNGNHIHVYPFRFHPYSRPADSCLSFGCYCTGYLAPEPPKPERKAWVVELDAAYADTMGGTAGFVPLDEYLAAHPQPSPALCICGGWAAQHWVGATGGHCNHVPVWCDERGNKVHDGFCQCQKFAAQP